MADALDLSDPDFTAQMQGLVEQAQQVMGERASTPRPAPQERAGEKEAQQRALQSYQSLPQTLRPFVVALEAITRTSVENTQTLAKLEKTMAESGEALRQIPGAVTQIQSLVEKKDAFSKQMFDALHEELRSYKDSFLLEAMYRPIIRDLITLYDDLSEIHRQMQSALALSSAEEGGDLMGRFADIEVNMRHNLEFILEVLARLEVMQMPIGDGKLDKKNQRAVALEDTDNPEEDFDVLRTLKRGFFWRDRVVRAEEVVIKKTKQGPPVVLPSNE